MGNGWTLEDEMKCRAMKAEGRTAGYMAIVMGRTRNSILGFMNRRGILGKPKSTQTQRAALKRAIHKHREEHKRFKETLKSTGPSSIANKHPEFNRNDGILMDDLSINQCRWPVTQGKPYRFCGDSTHDRSYCEIHDDLAHDRSCRKKSRLI